MAEARLDVYVQMRGRIEAERVLDLYELLVAAGGRHMKNGENRAWVSTVRGRAMPPSRRRVQGRVLPPAALARTLAAQGIHMEPPKQKRAKGDSA